MNSQVFTFSSYFFAALFLQSCTSGEVVKKTKPKTAMVTLSVDDCDNNKNCPTISECTSAIMEFEPSKNDVLGLVSALENNMATTRETPPVFVPHFGRWLELDEAACYLAVIFGFPKSHEIAEADQDDDESHLCRAIKISRIYKAFAMSYPPIYYEHLDVIIAPEKFDFSLSKEDGAEEVCAAQNAYLERLSEMIDYHYSVGKIRCSAYDKVEIRRATESYFSKELSMNIERRLCY